MARLSTINQGALGKTPEHNTFRSENMSYVQIYMQQDVAQNTVRELGHLKALQFVDLNAGVTAFQRRYADEVKRCDELDRTLRWFRELVKQDKTVRLAEAGDASEGFEEVENKAGELQKQLHEATQHVTHLTNNLNASVELREVLLECEKLMSDTSLAGGPQGPGEADHMHSLLDHDMEQHRDAMTMRTVCGALPTDQAPILERVLFRATRGNCMVRFSETPVTLVDPATGLDTHRTVFAVFFFASRIEGKVQKVVEALRGSRHAFPAHPAERKTKLAELERHIADLTGVLERTQAERRQTLLVVAAVVESWRAMVVREKAVFNALNLFSADMSQRAVVCEGWCVERRLQEVRHALQRGMEMSRSSTPSILTLKAAPSTPPTFFHTNKLTSSFQAIVDAYGVADYKELNPAPFTVITFPFLFAVMFGDIGHGTLLTVFALWMLWKEKYFQENKPGEIFGICFAGRYVIVLMGFFSIYTGFLYNETFSLSANMFDSPYSVHYDGKVNGTVLYHVSKADHTYPFGVDPIWKQSDNELTFTNALKMKMSIVFGVLQMAFGIVLSAVNYVHRRDWVSLINVFVPQLLFLMSIFGYMVVLIIVKWATHYSDTSCAPSILTTFINMFLSMGSVEKIDNANCKLHGSIIADQESVQQVLLVVAVLSVPWMLLAKPLIDRCKHKRPARARVSGHEELGSPVHGGGGGEHGEHGEYDFAEEMVHNIIHTIEFVLGAVSNTASYLRLWALSLAHGQLSTVFWEKTLVSGFQGGGVLTIVVGFFVWILCTLGVLMVMESLSAFLHALRLHWVEFQNKFYHGTGIAFQPFAFKKVDEGEGADD